MKAPKPPSGKVLQARRCSLLFDDTEMGAMPVFDSVLENRRPNEQCVGLCDYVRMWFGGQTECKETPQGLLAEWVGDYLVDYEVGAPMHGPFLSNLILSARSAKPVKSSVLRAA